MIQSTITTNQQNHSNNLDVLSKLQIQFMQKNLEGMQHPTVYENPPIIIQGYIYDNETENPIKNAEVLCCYMLGTYAVPNITKTTTDKTGLYTLNLSVNQNFVVFARTPLYYTKFKYFDSTSKNMIWINFSLSYGRIPETSKLCGVVTEKDSSKPVSNACIFTMWQNARQDLDMNITYSDSKGYYEIDVSYGYVATLVFAEGYLPSTSYYGNWFWVDWDETIWKNVSLYKIPQQNSTICGYITDQESGEPVEDATLLVTWKNNFGMSFNNISYTDYDGFYTIHVAAGEGSIHITHLEYYYQEIDDLSIDENMTRWINTSLESIELMYKTYKYTWSKQNGEELIGEDLFASKKVPYEDTFTVNTAKGTVLTNVEVHLIWEDDFTYGLLVKKGLDTLSAEISHNSESIFESSEGNGNFTFSFAINDRPADGFVEAKDRAEAEDIINDLIKDKNKATVDTTVIVETGERIWRFFKYIKDNGNDFKITVSYVYYLYSLEEIDS